MKKSEDWKREIEEFKARMAERDRLEKEKLREMKTRQRDAEGRESRRNKKERDKRLILGGLVLEQLVDKHPQVRALVQETAEATLTRARDREIFGLETAPPAAAPKSAPSRKAAKKATASADSKE